MNFSRKNKNSIKSLFNSIADNYDIVNNIMSFGMQKSIKEKAVEQVLKSLNYQPEKILDLCCGTGEISRIFKKLSPNSQVTGIDFSEKMLKIAQEKNSNITYLNADITEKNFVKDKYDICFISFGLRNLPDIDSFLENIKNVMKKDSIIGILDTGKPVCYMKPYFFIHYNIIIPLVALLFNKNIMPYKYFTESTKTYPKQSKILEKLQQHGFKKAENKNFFFGIISLQTAQYNQHGE